MTMGEKTLLDPTDRAYVIAASLCIGRSRRGGNDSKMLHDYVPKLVAFINPGAHGADFRMELIESIGKRNPDMMPNSMIALADLTCEIRSPKSEVKPAKPSAIAAPSPQKSPVTRKKASKKSARKTAG